MGARAYSVLDRYADRLSGAIVEIGADRGEGSTRYLLETAAKRGLPFFSYDSRYGAGTGEQWLESTYPKLIKIAFAYLDNFDWTYDAIRNESWYLQQVAEYASQGVELTNENSQLAHLEQAKSVSKYAAKTSLILFDDTWYAPSTDTYHGKGGSATPWLLRNGWTLVDRVVSDFELFNGYVLVGKGLWNQ
jgi:hypothetical protein